MSSTTAPVDVGGAPRSRTVPRWLRESWVAALAVYCLGFAVYGAHRYTTFESRFSRVPIRADVPVHYPLLALHVLTGAVAVSLAWLQVWPWLRERRPDLHRRIGRTYFFAGVFPSAVLAFPVAVLTPGGQGIRAVLLTMAVLWSITAVAGFRAAVQGRYADHRRWMLRNVAMTTTIITSRILSVLFVDSTLALLPGTYDDQRQFVYLTMSATGLWAAIVLHLFFVEWVLLRPRSRRRRAA